MSWPAYYTNNFCPNPSAEVSLTGYAGILGTEQLAQYPLGYAGSSSVQVITPGNVPGEGISTPAGTVVATVSGSATVAIYGETGTLVVQALQNPGGQILGTAFVQLDGQDWQRAEIDTLAMTANDNVYLAIYTQTAQALTFYVDAVQYEPETPAHPYVDGDSKFATWTGTPGLSTSYQQYQFPVSLDGSMVLGGTMIVVAQGEIFPVGVVSGMMDMSGDAHQMAAATVAGRTVIAPATDTGILGQPWWIAGGGLISGIVVLNPAGEFAAFGVWETGVDPDPAMTLIGYNNAGTLDASEVATSYAQLFGTFTPPQQSLDSAGRARWQAAAYMAAGFRIASQPVWSSGSPGAVNFNDVQVEKMTQQGPTAYQLPRSLNTIIKPTRLNYVTNPSFETSLAGWTAINGATLTQLGSGFESSHSMQVSVPSAGGGVYIAVPDLILGDTFIASAYIDPTSANIADITIAMGGKSASANPTGYPYGAGGYGSGPYGGVNASGAPMVTGEWVYRPWVSCAAPESTLMLSFIPVAITGATYPLVFNIDLVLVEPGEVLESYGDGSTSGWEWELGGTANLSRSYFYERQGVGVNAVHSVLQQHIPLGLTAYEPAYFLPPSQ